MKYAKRRDNNHAEVRDGLRACGWSVFDAGSVGDDLPDLIVGAAGITVLVEVKSKGGRLSAGQSAFADAWRGGPVVTVWSLDEAIRAVTVAIGGGRND